MLEVALPYPPDNPYGFEVEEHVDELDEQVPRVVIGMDPHKRTVTVEVMTGEEIIVGAGRYATDPRGYADLVRYAKQ